MDRSRAPSPVGRESVLEQRLLAEAPSLDGVPSRGSGWLEGPPRRPGDLVRRRSREEPQKTVAFGVVLGSEVVWLPPLEVALLPHDLVASVRRYTGRTAEAERLLSLGLDWDKAWNGCLDPGVLLHLAVGEEVEERLVVLAACDLTETLLPRLPTEEQRLAAAALLELRRWALGRASADAARAALRATYSMGRGWNIASVIQLVGGLSEELTGNVDGGAALSIGHRALREILGGLLIREEWQDLRRAVGGGLARVVAARLPLPVFCAAVARGLYAATAEPPRDPRRLGRQERGKGS